MKIKKDYVWSGIVAALVVSLIVLIILNPIHGHISANKAGSIAENLFSSAYPQYKFSVSKVVDMGNFYRVYLSANGNELEVDVSKDGKYIGKLNLIEKIEQQITQSEEKAKFAPPKKDAPDVKLFVMPFCPFGRPAENSLYQVHKILGNNTNMEIHYIIEAKTDEEIRDQMNSYKSMYNLSDEKINEMINQTEQNSLKISNNNMTYFVMSLHGKEEAKEAIRELCMWKYYPNKTWDYIWDMNHNCTSDLGKCEDSKWEQIASSVGIDPNKISDCYENEGLSLVLKESDIDNEFRASASPTLIVNGEVYNGNDRSANGYKNAVCLGFTNEPSECSTNLSSSNEAASGNC